MSATTLNRPVVEWKTTEDLMAMPEDGIRRWIVDGIVKEIGMTQRNRFHAKTEANVSYELNLWAKAKPKPRFSVLSGEAGVRLTRNPDVSFGADVTLISPEVMALQTGESTIIEGIPHLIVEIASPSDTFETWFEKITQYKKYGVPLTWIVNPYERTVGIHRPGQPPVVLNETQELICEPELPGFRVPVIQLFDDI